MLKKKKENINLLSLILFSIKILLFEKTFLIFFLFANAFALLVSIVTVLISNGEMINLFYDYFAIIYINIFNFVLIIRAINFFFVRKVDDKTIFISISNSISRLNYFFANYITICLVFLINMLFCFLSFNLVFVFSNNFKIEYYMLMKSLYFLIFCFLVLFSLLNFVIFLNFYLGAQSALVISIVLLSLSFVSNVPLNLFQNKLDSNSLTSINTLNVKTIYEAFDLQKSINNGEIKYKYLTKSINDYFLNNKAYELENSLNKSEVLKLRYENYWNDYLKLINNEFKEVVFNGKVAKLSKSMTQSDKPEDWKNTNVKATFNLNSYFKSEDDLLIMINDNQLGLDKEKILILTDLYNLTNEIKQRFNNLLFDKYKLFSNYIYLTDNGKTDNYVVNAKNNDKAELFKSDLKTIYEVQITKNNPDDSNFDLVLIPSDEIESTIKENLNFPLMYVANIVEGYLTEYFDYYYNFTNYPLELDSHYNQYINTINASKVLEYISPFFGIWNFYTEYSGFYYDDIWFDIENDSKINLKSQENLFLPYSLYSFVLDDNNIIKEDSYNNYVNPVYYILFYFFTSIGLLALGYYKFNKDDF